MAKISKLTLALSLLLITQLPALSHSWQEDDASARALMKQGKYDEAQDALLHALANCPPEQRGSVLLHLSIVQRKSGNMEGARKTLMIAKEHASKERNADLSEKIDREIVKLSVPARELPEVTQPDNDQSADPKILHAGVQLLDNLPAVSSKLSPGNRLDERQAAEILKDRIQGATPNSTAETWRRVPDWRAGLWTQSMATNVYTKDLITGLVARPNDTYLSESEHFKGECADSEGHAWERVKNGFWTVPTKHLATVGNAFVTKKVCVETDNSHCVEYTEAISFTSTYHGMITETYQSARLTRYDYVGDGLYRSEQRIRRYDAAGRPVSDSVHTSIGTRSYSFRPVRSPALDLSLSAYLQSHNLGYLSPVPIETTSSARR
ncbi:MAG: hypothetical protein K2W95_32775 [Candidatus Obscuribacterales bacterium]|nr:hypothetical protein [Candidatus Obscuribacterales bacterium]